MNANHVITAYYRPGPFTEIAPQYQYNSGQVLRLEEFKDIPEYFEMHFSNDRKAGKSTTVIGHNNLVQIPDQYFTKGLDIWAWLYLTDGAGAETMYTIKIPVIRRPGGGGMNIDDDQREMISELIDALNNGVARAEAAADRAEATEAGAAGEFIEALESGEVILDDGDASEWIEEEEDESNGSEGV